jgi:isopentenyl-diphosphate delta-isomerase
MEAIQRPPNTQGLRLLFTSGTRSMSGQLDVGVSTTDAAEERVVLLDPARRPIGTALKSVVHGTDTPLHLAFSCHVYDSEGRVLLTRRSLGKQAWPGVWTNSVCGHPAPGEEMADAVRRRTRYELGIDVDELSLVLPDFQYRAVDASGIVENEFCPVYTARTVDTPNPRPSEVSEFEWAKPEDVQVAVAATPWAFSPWLVLQLAAIREVRR